MNFDYTEEERALAEQARRLLADKSPPSLIRSLLEGEGADRREALWTEISALGWPAVAIPESQGGIEFGHVALCALAEEIGRAVAPLPMLPSIYLAAEAIAAAGTQPQMQRWLPALASGEIIGTAFLTPGAITVRDGRLTGSVSPVPYGAEAGVAIISATDGLHLVDLTRPGVTRSVLNTIDDSVPHAAITFDAVEAEPLGARNGSALGDHIVSRAAVLVAFEQLGGAEACLQMALGYVRERKTFARVIGSYQAIKHRLTDIYVATEVARSNAYYAAWALATGAPELPLAAAAARIAATEAYEFASAECIQIHGGIGFTWEADCHLHYRRSRLLAQALGPIAQWHDRLADALDRREAA
ncbi:acyl-CoA/acyl-ACP dehydrogenase [Sphingobium phenoxybenzoativorans]|uniref:Acyl-CoA/acyl-ACP dehydrogenase n=1 Tax=Sphingobium phenoxybenzoativorans TaxID=1592790 RepID=A0A975K8E7_9SPHN|nr:acyl-CoA dehydrogenase family protein [Sphingobium phenoxybenzoativorans]QUT06704.1 acyl-CoA/acyl-ACP dehydrogenase [Sphingobium phenoxybenzoativorans]